MKKKNLLIRILSLIMLVCVALTVISCADEKPSGGGNGGGGDTGAGATDFLVAEVGYDWEIPTPTNISNYTATVKESKTDGQELTVTDGKVHFDKVGEYILTYANSSDEKYITVKVVDTEDPRFDKWWTGEWKDHWGETEEITLKGTKGETFDMSEYFKCYDNSGSAQVTYKVLRGGVDEITLTDGKTFEIEETDFYLLTATAKDASNNYAYIQYKLVVGFTTVPENEKPALGDADYGVKNSNVDYRHSGLYIGSPEGAKAGDVYNVTFKVKADFVGASSQQILIMKGIGAGCPGWSSYDEGIFVSQEYQTVSVDGVYITTGAQFLTRYGPSVLGTDASLMPGDVSETDVGLFLCYYGLPASGTVWVKDVEFTFVSAAPETPDTPETPTDGEYTLTNSTGSYKHTGLYIGKPENAEVGDKYNVTFKINVGYDLTSKGFYVMTGTETTSSRVSTDVTTLTQGEWCEVTLNGVAITTGQQFSDHMLAIGFHKDDYDLSAVNATSEGVFIFNYVHVAGGTISVKDVVFTSEGQTPVTPPSTDDAEFTVQNNTSSYRHSGLYIGKPDGANLGDKYNVTLKIKQSIVTSSGSSQQILAMKTTSSTDAMLSIMADTVFTTADTWIEITLSDAMIVTGAQFIARVGTENVGADVTETDEGIFLYIYGHPMGATISVKDVTFEKVGETTGSESTPLEGYNYVTPVAENANGVLVYEAAAGTKYNVSFKVRINATSISSVGIAVLCGSTVAGTAGASQRVSATYTTSTDGWEDVTLNGILSMSGADMMAAATAEGWGNGFTNIDENATGIYIWSFWFGEGTTIEIKDIVVTPA